MLVLQGNKELEQTFQKVIQTMDARVAWEGRFIINGNEMILEGKVRSLVFQFETKMVLTDLIDLPVEENKVLEVSEHPKLQDLINIVLYAFGKWRTLRGLRVEQDYAQLNKLFERVLKPYYIEPSFRKENFRFYKDDVRITYEEVLDIALESEEKPQEGTNEEEEQSQGLWHTIVWMRQQRQFHKEDTTLEERRDDRLGNNFYLVGYQCPDCSEKMHMAVYPPGMEMRIDTQEKGVFIARVFTCSKCHCFYTPRPGRLLAEGDIYEMRFGTDEKAYDDYLELLGKNAERTANFKYNEYEALRGKTGDTQEPDIGAFSDANEALQEMESFSRKFDDLPESVFRRFTYRVEDGFFPDAAVAKHEKKILQQIKKRNLDVPSPNKNDGQPANVSNIKTEKRARNHIGNAQDYNRSDGNAWNRNKADGNVSSLNIPGKNASDDNRSENISDQDAFHHNIPDQDAFHHNISDKDTDQGVSDVRPWPNEVYLRRSGESGEELQPSEQSGIDIAQYGIHNERGFVPEKDTRLQNSVSANVSRVEKYQARFGVWDRLSDRQKAELKRKIQNDAGLSDQEKMALLHPLEEALQKERIDVVIKKVNSSGQRSYRQINKVIQELDSEKIPGEIKRSLNQKLQGMLIQRGNEEVRQIIEKLPERFDRSGYRELERKLQEYKEVDLSPYEELLQQKREEAEQQEIAGIVRRARKKSRADFVGLMRRLEEQAFADNVVIPYMEKIKEKLRETDVKRLEEISDKVQYMDFGEAADAYEKISQGNFLPELKDNALEMLSKRLQKIRTDECELLVQKLKEEMQGKIRENARHHFYPARKVMRKTAEAKETAAIDAALNSYAGGRSMFEYPILSVDTSRNHSGREGMLLTPDNLFYSTRMNSYEIPVGSIASVTASLGVLNRKIALEETNGAVHKLPYAVKTGEMESWAKVLNDFIGYLQQKPASRKLKYLAKETHDTICCFRCGHIYRGSDVCPECGYKKNR